MLIHGINTPPAFISRLAGRYYRAFKTPDYVVCDTVPIIGNGQYKRALQRSRKQESVFKFPDLDLMSYTPSNSDLWAGVLPVTSSCSVGNII